MLARYSCLLERSDIQEWSISTTQLRLQGVVRSSQLNDPKSSGSNVEMGRLYVRFLCSSRWEDYMRDFYVHHYLSVVRINSKSTF